MRSLRAQFTVLEIFESPHCQGGDRALDADDSARPSVFAERTPTGELLPNGADGPPTRPFWLPFLAQRGENFVGATFDRSGLGDVHYDPEYWFAARYSRGQRCGSFQDATCCGLIDDSAVLRYAVARFASGTGAPSAITCVENMRDDSPQPDLVAQQDPGLVQCLAMSDAWVANANHTTILGEDLTEPRMKK